MVQVQLPYHLVDVAESRGVLEELELGALDVDPEHIDVVEPEPIQEIVEGVQVDFEVGGVRPGPQS